MADLYRSEHAVTIPVILDTDIGLDVDDVWALALLLRCPELDLKLVVSSTGDTRYGASLAARLLTIAGRTDVPVGIGISVDPELPKTHAGWLADYDVGDYEGDCLKDGVGALIDVIRSQDEPVTIVEIGPTRNLAAALERAHDITRTTRLVGMLGSLRIGYLGAPEPAREYNVVKDPASCQATLSAPWDTVLVPLDSCGAVRLAGHHFEQLRASPDPLLRAVLENHFGWAEAVKDWPIMKRMDPRRGSSILFDTVPVYLAFASDLVTFESLPVTVTDDGWTRIDSAGRAMSCATGWRDGDAFLDFLVDRYTAAASSSIRDR